MGGAAVADPGFLKAARALYIDGVTAAVVTALGDAGIGSILLKGPSIARWLYPAGGRTYADTDLLVAPPDFARAEAVLRDLGFVDMLAGFSPFERSGQTAETAFLRARARAHGEGDGEGDGGGGRLGGKVDLHRNLPDLAAPDTLVWDVLVGVSETMSVGGAEVRVLNRVGLALHIVLHAVQHQFGSHTDEDLRRAVDALPFEDWRRVAALAERLGVVAPVGAALRRHAAGAVLADRLGLPPDADPASAAGIGVPRGANTMARLRAAASVGERARIVRWALLPSPAKARFVGGRSVAAGYVRHWRAVATALGPAVRSARADRRR